MVRDEDRMKEGGREEAIGDGVGVGDGMTWKSGKIRGRAIETAWVK